MKLGNNNDAGSTKISPVPPGLSTTVNMDHQNTSKVSRSDRAEPAPVSSPELNPKPNGEQQSCLLTIVFSHIVDIFDYIF